MTPPIASNVFFMNSAIKIWETLKQRFSQLDDTRICNQQCTLSNLTQGPRSVDSYFTKLNTIWEELKSYRPLPHYKAYSLVLRAESKRNLYVTQPLSEFSVMMVVNDKGKNKNDLICSHYGKKGHVKEKCYRIIGFLENFKFTRGISNHAKNRSTANSAVSSHQLEQEEETIGFMSQMILIKNQV
ncbi:Uncharacterized protein TCM_010443 [Theobroma cacao]|uniref:Uncharacterized protein n=1 Tax=Theobroma cacao TaxID=3641 RepID=A0A061E7D9_THECC|nr:Uncharacterized protein TCM_010443 [Theobroma cacao]